MRASAYSHWSSARETGESLFVRPFLPAPVPPPRPNPRHDLSVPVILLITLTHPSLSSTFSLYRVSLSFARSHHALLYKRFAGRAVAGQPTCSALVLHGAPFTVR